MTDFTILLLGYLGAGFFFGSASYFRGVRNNVEMPELYAIITMLRWPYVAVFLVPAMPIKLWFSWLERMARR